MISSLHIIKPKGTKEEKYLKNYADDKEAYELFFVISLTIYLILLFFFILKTDFKNFKLETKIVLTFLFISIVLLLSLLVSVFLRQKLFIKFYILSYLISIPILPILYLIRIILEKSEKREKIEKDEEKEAFIEEGTREGILEREESKLIKGVLDFSETLVREVMTPRIDIVAIDSSATLRESLKVFAQSRHTRLPVYEGLIDNIIGVIFLKDILENILKDEEDKNIKEFIKPILFVPENKPISSLLKEFQQKREHIAIVVDEYGGVDGLVTTEDLIEEIVGELEEIGEKEEENLIISEDNSIIVKGKTSLKDVSEAGFEIKEGDYDSVAGWISTKLGYIPQSGQSFIIDNFEVQILLSDKRRIHKVKIKKLEDKNAKGNS